jgi:phage FluMu gp28-like protein
LPYSELYGIAQGPDVIRQHTGSGLFCDEGAFQESLSELIGAAKPMLSGGGRLDIVSSAAPGFFQDLVEDRVR